MTTSSDVIDVGDVREDVSTRLTGLPGCQKAVPDCVQLQPLSLFSLRLKAGVKMTNTYHYTKLEPSGSKLGCSYMLTVLIHNVKTTWSTKISMPF